MTDERSVLNEYASLMNWLETTAMEMSEEVFFKPIKPGKWSPAEILSHIMKWDDYLLEERIPHMKSGATLPKLENVEAVNNRAAKFARSGITQKELIKETIKSRKRVVERLLDWRPIEWKNTFYIDKYPLCLTSYIKGLIEHDEHHKLQIEVFMNEQGIPHSLFTT